MADSVEHEVSSTTPLFNEDVHHYQAEPDSELDQPKPDLFSADDIVDLVGGAQDALNRHFAEDSAPHESTETSFSPPEEPVTLLEPEPVSVPEPEPEPEPEVETASPDSTSFSFVPETASFAEEPKVVAPEAEPESTKIVPEPQAAPEPEPAPESDALPVAEPRKAAPAPAEAAEQPAVTEEAPAPASCEYLHRTGPVHYSSTEFWSLLSDACVTVVSMDGRVHVNANFSHRSRLTCLSIWTGLALWARPHADTEMNKWTEALLLLLWITLNHRNT